MDSMLNSSNSVFRLRQCQSFFFFKKKSRIYDFLKWISKTMFYEKILISAENFRSKIAVIFFRWQTQTVKLSAKHFKNRSKIARFDFSFFLTRWMCQLIFIQCAQNPCQIWFQEFLIYFDFNIYSRHYELLIWFSLPS